MKKKHVFLFSMSTFALVAALGGTPPLAIAQTAPRSEAPRSERALLFVLTTGPEDMQTMSSVFRHAAAAARTGRLREVALLVYGRGVLAFNADAAARPPELVRSIRAAMQAGVRIMVCAHALQSQGLSREHLDPGPTEIVPNAIETLVDYAARDAVVVRY